MLEQAWIRGLKKIRLTKFKEIVDIILVKIIENSAVVDRIKN